MGDMTQDMSYFAVSKRTPPTRQMDFPYNSVTASVGFGCNQNDEWMYVAFSEAPNIANVETGDEFNLLVSTINFDGDATGYELTQKFGARFLHFRNDDLVSAKVAESSSMIFEVDWYREGIIRFDFALAGSSEAIEGARSKCNKSDPILIALLTPADLWVTPFSSEILTNSST